MSGQNWRENMPLKGKRNTKKSLWYHSLPSSLQLFTFTVSKEKFLEGDILYVTPVAVQLKHPVGTYRKLCTTL